MRAAPVRAAPAGPCARDVKHVLDCGRQARKRASFGPAKRCAQIMRNEGGMEPWWLHLFGGINSECAPPGAGRRAGGITAATRIQRSKESPGRGRQARGLRSNPRTLRFLSWLKPRSQGLACAAAKARRASGRNAKACASFMFRIHESYSRKDGADGRRCKPLVHV